MNDRWMTVLMLAVFAVMILTGMTTSSIGMPHLAEDPNNLLRDQLGRSQLIRSDEYNISTPIAMSIMNTGGAPTLSPLSEPGDISHRFTSGGLFESIVFFPSLLLHLGGFLPQQMVFSAYWWLPMILLFLGLPIWMERIAGSRRLGWLAAMLIAFSPAVAWWSLGPVIVLGYPVAGCALLFIASERYRARRWVTFGLAAAGSGVLLASIPTVYAPWAIVLAVPLVLATIAAIVSGPGGWRERIWPTVAAGVVAVVLAAGTLFENRATLLAFAGTVYPGQRRSGPMAESLGLLLGAPAFSVFRKLDPTTSNSSELSSGFTVAALLAVLLLGVVILSRPLLRHHLGLAVIAVSTAIWLAWSMVNTGGIGEKIPLLNLVPPYRSAQVVGMLAVVLVCMVLALPMRGDRRQVALAGAVLTGMATAYGVSTLRGEAAPSMPTWLVLTSSLGVAVAVFVITWRPFKVWTVAVVGLLAFSTVALSQPWLFGLADLRGSHTAQEMRDRGASARKDGTLWASDSTSFDTLMLASGVPSLSGFQRSGPDVAQWERLDPDHRFENAWNRAGGYLPFVFSPGRDLDITTTGFDITFVSIDPCELLDRFPEVGHLASTSRLSEACVVPDGRLQWSGVPMYLYRAA